MKAVFPLNCSRGSPGVHLTSDLVKGRQVAASGMSSAGTGMFRHRLNTAGLALSMARNVGLQQSSSNQKAKIFIYWTFLTSLRSDGYVMVKELAPLHCHVGESFAGQG